MSAVAIPSGIPTIRSRIGILETATANCRVLIKRLISYMTFC